MKDKLMDEEIMKYCITKRLGRLAETYQQLAILTELGRVDYTILFCEDEQTLKIQRKFKKKLLEILVNMELKQKIKTEKKVMK